MSGGAGMLLEEENLGLIIVWLERQQQMLAPVLCVFPVICGTALLF